MEPGAQGQRRGRKLTGPEAAAARGDCSAPADWRAVLDLMRRNQEALEARLAVMQASLTRLESAANDSNLGGDEGNAADRVVTHGRLRHLPGFNDVWLGGTHYDLSERPKARLCIQFLVEQNAFDPASARHLTDEIDPYVRQHGDYPPSVDIKIDHYFKDHKGGLPRLRKELIVAAGRHGRYFLKVD